MKRYEKQRTQMTISPLVKHISECFIKPKYDVEDARDPIYLAPLDLGMLSANYIQKGLLFPKPSSLSTIDFLLDNLKHSLSLTLVPFYPLAGRFKTEIDEDQHTSLIFIDCNKGPGARFIHANLDMTISDILEPDDVPLVVQSFFDHDRAVSHDGHTRPLLSIQVTELIDGIFIGCSMNHACGDGTSYWHFFNMWSEIFMKNEDTTLVSRPPINHRWFLDGTGPIIKIPFTDPDEFIVRFEAPCMRERIFHFSSESIVKLKAKANKECGVKHISSFQALSALVWRCITKARSLPNDLDTKCSLAFNNRGRLNPPLSNNCFGNAVYVVYGSCKVGELLNRDLGWVASLFYQAVSENNDEKVRNVIKDWMESPFIFQPAGLGFAPQNVHMGSSPRFDMYGNEFGLGKALSVLSGYANKFDGKVTSYPGRDGGGSIDLEITLSPDTMRVLESDREFMDAVLLNP